MSARSGCAMISEAQSRALGAHLVGLYHAQILQPSDLPLTVIRFVSSAIVTALPATRGALDLVGSHLATVSMTLPTPVGTLILLSDVALSSPESYSETIAHECQHACQIKALGGPAMALDYLASGELRATREAHAYVVGIFVRYLLTGELPMLDEAMVPLSGGLYHLGDGDLATAKGIVRSGLATIAAEECPPYVVAIEALAWFRDHAPDAIVGRVLS